MICKNAKCKKEIPDESIFCMWCGRRQVPAVHKKRARPNGTGTVYQLPSGKYKAEVVTGYHTIDGKLKKTRVTGVFTTKKEAYDAIPSLKERNTEKRPTETATLQQMYDIYTASKAYDSLAKTSRDKMTYAWNRLKKLYNRPIASLTIDDMQEEIDANTESYYPAKDMKTILSHCFTAAIRREIVAYNKTMYLELPELKKSKRKAFSDSELKRFWDDWNDGNTFTGYILIMTYAGLRYGEMSTILKRNVHLDELYMIGGIKSDAGIDRTIPIAEKILPVVQHFYNNCKKKLLEMNEDNFYKSYWETIDRLNISHLPPHTCRHTYFTALASAGVQPGIITAAGGHRSYDVTLQYTHVPLRDLLNAVNKIV